MRLRVTVAVVLVALGTTAVLAFVGFPGRMYLDNDFIQFWAAGRLLLEGRDPYDPATFVDMHRRIGSAGHALIPGTGFWYPLPTGLVAIPFALLPVGLAASAWLVAQVAVAATGLWALGRMILAPTFRRDAPMLAAVVAAAQPAWVLAVSGNLGGFLLGIVAWALALFLRDRPFAMGAALGLLVVKPHPFLVFVLVAVLLLGRRERIRAIAGGSLSSGFLVLASLAIRPSWPREWIESAVTQRAVGAIRADIWGIVPADTAWAGPLLTVLIATAIAVWYRWRRPAKVHVLAVSLAFSLLVAPYIWSYDHLALLGCAAVVALATVASWREPARIAALAAVAACVVVLPWVMYAIAFARGNEGLSAIVPVAVMTLLVAVELADRAQRPRPAVQA